ncbi:hypothetical protein [Streptomyces sp. NPDC055506]
MAPVGLMGGECLWRRDLRYWRARAQRELPPGWPLLAAESGSAGFADLGAQFTLPLLLMVTTRLFGCPVELGDELVMDLWRMLDGGLDADPATARALASFTRLAAHRRARPGDDLTSYLLLADRQHDPQHAAGGHPG